MVPPSNMLVELQLTLKFIGTTTSQRTLYHRTNMGFNLSILEMLHTPPHLGYASQLCQANEGIQIFLWILEMALTTSIFLVALVFHVELRSMCSCDYFF